MNVPHLAKVVKNMAERYVDEAGLYMLHLSDWLFQAGDLYLAEAVDLPTWTIEEIVDASAPQYEDGGWDDGLSYIEVCHFLATADPS